MPRHYMSRRGFAATAAKLVVTAATLTSIPAVALARENARFRNLHRVQATPGVATNAPTPSDIFYDQLTLDSAFAHCRSPIDISFGWADPLDWGSMLNPGGDYERITSDFALVNVSAGLLSAAVNVWANAGRQVTQYEKDN